MLKKKKKKRPGLGGGEGCEGWECSSVVKHFLRMCEVCEAQHHTHIQKKKKKSTTEPKQKPLNFPLKLVSPLSAHPVAQAGNLAVVLETSFFLTFCIHSVCQYFDSK
jgi:hypothetical protein